MLEKALSALAEPLGRLVLAVGTGEKTFWLPRQGSTLAADVDHAWAVVYWMSVFFFVLVVSLMFLFVFRYRATKVDKAEGRATHNTPLELVWTIIPTLLVVWLFWAGFDTYMNAATPPANSYEIQVTGQKWNWLFTYPNGYVDGNLHVPVDTPVTLLLSSEDVMHSFYVPEFRIKRDVIPGRINKLWFEATDVGVYDVFCAEYCGTSHSGMLSKVHVHELGEFDAWLEDASNFLDKMPPADAGELLYNMRGCKQCHSVDGSAGIAPTFQGLFGSEEQLVGGQKIVVDENYILNSVYDPLGQVVAGYDPVMPTFRGRLKPEEVNAIIAYIKTLSAE